MTQMEINNERRKDKDEIIACMIITHISRR